MQIILIAAMAANRVIGRDNDIPWHLPEEQQRFKKITMGHTLVMGRKTYESIGRALPGRTSIVITRQPQYKAPGCLMAESLGKALALAGPAEKVFIIGGEGVFRESLEKADAIYLSTLDRQVDGDIFFPEFDENTFRLVSEERVQGEDPYTFAVYQRPGQP